MIVYMLWLDTVLCEISDVVYPIGKQVHGLKRRYLIFSLETKTSPLLYTLFLMS